MEQVEGIVQAVSQKGEGRFSVKLTDGNWYGGFGKPPEKGDVVKIDYEINQQWRNIKKLEKTGKDNSEFVSAKDYIQKQEDRDSMITRSVAFKGAIEILNGLMTNKEIAYSFEGTIDAIKKYTDAFEEILKNQEKVEE